MPRTYLTAPLTINFGPCDAAGVWAHLRDCYDLAGQPVTLQAAPGLYDKGIVCSGDLLGQSFVTQVQIIGDPTNPVNCTIAPKEDGDCFGFNGGARCVLSGFQGTYYVPGSVVPAEGILSVGDGACVELGRPGDACAFMFANISGPAEFNDITVNGNARLWVQQSTSLKFCAEPASIKQCAFDIGDGGSLLFLTNGGQAPLALAMDNAPTYNSGIFRFADHGRGVLGASYSGLVHGEQWHVVPETFGSVALYAPSANIGLMWGDVGGTPAVGTPGVSMYS